MGDLFPERIQTDRLVLEAAAPDTVDVLDFYRICSADDGIETVTAFLTWEPHSHPRETLEFLESAVDQRAAGGGCQYVIRPPGNEDGVGDIAGMCGLTVDWDRRVGQPGVWLRRRFWGRGYGAERAAALFALAFRRLDLDCVAVEVHADNERSKRSVDRYVERFGGRYEGLCRHADAWSEGPVDLHRWTVTSGEFANADIGVDVTIE